MYSESWGVCVLKITLSEPPAFNIQMFTCVVHAHCAKQLIMVAWLLSIDNSTSSFHVNAKCHSVQLVRQNKSHRPILGFYRLLQSVYFQCCFFLATHRKCRSKQCWDLAVGGWSLWTNPINCILVNILFRQVQHTTLHRLTSAQKWHINSHSLQSWFNMRYNTTLLNPWFQLDERCSLKRTSEGPHRYIQIK